MPRIDFVVASQLARTSRVKQLEGMFDVPAQEKLSHHWQGDVPIEKRDWNIGLIVGPSGSGKSQIMRKLFGEPVTFEWPSKSVIDDFAEDRGIQEITASCSAVGFNTIPSWMKPYGVLSNGEKFRVELARHMIETPDPIVVDEFTSVVDRQVAQIASHAVQKYIRKAQRKFVAVSCHYDILDWLQPDWVLEPATMTFQWRAVQRRPAINVEIARVDHSAWKLFAPFHYLTAELHKGAACYVLFVDGRPASFVGVLHRPHPKVDDIKGVSRAVTLPDYQGLGLAFVLFDTMGAAYKACDYRLRIYPAHPSFVRSADRSRTWALKKKPGVFSPSLGETSGLKHATRSQDGDHDGKKWHMGGRPCAVFEYCGPAMSDRADAEALLTGIKVPVSQRFEVVA